MTTSPSEHPDGPVYDNAVVRWIEYRLPIFSFVDSFMGSRYPAPRNLSYWWNFGSLAGLALVLQILTGVVLAMTYIAHTDMAFDSVERIMRDINFGWLLRYAHANGASMFFIVVYIHVFRGLYYGSYKAPREILWMLGVVILLLMMATAFMGYVLPWGQMSFWGATVITNLFSAIPIFGETIVTWLWGGFSVDNPTLNRFYSLHYLLPFVIVGVVALHLVALHQHGSNNPLGIERKSAKDSLPFHPYYTIKDLFGVGVYMIVLALLVFYWPNLLGHPDNYIPANPMQTPSHIVPEWYFLPFYAILRAITFDIWFIPAKLIGVVLMFASILLLFFLPWLDFSKVRSARFRPRYKLFFWVLLVDCVILGVVGANAPNTPVFAGLPAFQYVHLGQFATFWYFFHFFVLVPWLAWKEPTRPLPASISEPVLRGGGPQPAGATAKPMEKP
jgi:ubiquinol-cytochrome c reductase cytochrome b/c1 subunit